MNFSTRCLAFALWVLLIWVNIAAFWIIDQGSPWFGTGMLTMTAPMLLGYTYEIYKAW